MIWQEDVATIVMVTDRYQGNQQTGPEFYWPSKLQTSEIYDDITVLLLESTSYTTHTVRTLNLFKRNQKVHHTVRQIQIHSWEYGYVPEDEVVLISILKALKIWQDEENKNPLLVHCSNGSGASGVIIALYVLMDVIKKKEDISVFEFVKQMRDDRVDMVQTNLQYFFIFEALLAAIQSTDSLIKGDQLQKLDQSSIDQRAKHEYQVQQFLELFAICDWPHFDFEENVQVIVKLCSNVEYDSVITFKTVPLHTTSQNRKRPPPPLGGRIIATYTKK
ncbi:Receptor-type tyrosine-protein phosphatase F [Holothuria leucospilota]|uniref:Receptor-type tyrosine-protein phosphatase F n=1 Tax=Holothuria leucospilota TaxID=206669 RepID=A0A9Q1C8T6_HOLLE|nr:Receptor-type tyrosine-protein phosphatase F [Holothuria leucospilota]